MQYRPYFRTTILFGCLFAYSFAAFGNAVHISLKKALASKAVTIRAISNGGYCGKSLRLDLQNNSQNDCTIDVEPGLIFKPADSSYQNLVLLGSETITLGPATHTEVSLQTFCGKSYASCPASGISYNFWKQGDSLMVKALQYVKEKSVDIWLAQRAVWFFTNGYALNSVYSSDKFRMSEDLVKYIAALKKMKVPEYFVQYKLNSRANEPVVIRGKEKFYANMHWNTDDGYRHMYLTIYKSTGEIYKEIEADQVIDKYGSTVVVEFDAQRDMKGTYFVRLHDDANKVWDEKKVVIGDNM